MFAGAQTHTQYARAQTSRSIHRSPGIKYASEAGVSERDKKWEAKNKRTNFTIIINRHIRVNIDAECGGETKINHKTKSTAILM